MCESLLLLQKLVPKRDSWREGNVTEKGDGTCEISVNLIFLSVNKILVAARRHGVEVERKQQMMCILILLNKVFPRNRISPLKESKTKQTKGRKPTKPKFIVRRLN